MAASGEDPRGAARKSLVTWTPPPTDAWSATSSWRSFLPWRQWRLPGMSCSPDPIWGLTGMRQVGFSVPTLGGQPCRHRPSPQRELWAYKKIRCQQE